MAHTDGLAAFRRHFPLWAAMNPAAAIVLCPEDSLIDQKESGWPVFGVAKSQSEGRESWIRLRWLLDYLSRQDSMDQHLVFEYDSLCLSPTFTPQLGHCGVIQVENKVEFLAARYCNIPWAIDRQSIMDMWKTAQRWPDIYEGGHADRYFSALATMAGVPILPHRPPGYAKSLITGADIPELQAAIYRGATMIHGIKQKWVLEAALQFYDELDIVRPS